MTAGEVTWTRAGDVLRGWLAAPDDRAAPGLVLIPDVRGLSAHYRDVAGRFAAEGFATLAVDVYSREGAPELPDMDAVFRWMAALPDRRVLDDLGSAIAWLAGRGGPVGITGFCMGGQYALMAACDGRPLGACVSWYGMLRYAARTEAKPESALEMAHRLGCPWLGLYGEDDALIPAADLAELRATLVQAGRPFDVVTYRGAGHAFYNDTRPDAFRPDAARDAFSRAVAFLRRYLGG